MSGLSCEIFFSNIYARWISWNHHEFHDEHFSFISPPVILWILESEKRKSLVTSHLIRKRTALQNQEKVYGFSQAFENIFLKLPCGQPLSRYFKMFVFIKNIWNFMIEQTGGLSDLDRWSVWYLENDIDRMI